MRAAWYSENGNARDVLRVGDVADPEPDNGEVRVRLHTSGINPADTKWRDGIRFPIQFDMVIPHFDGGGVIDSVGSGISESRIGERVWVYEAQWMTAFGTAAQYVTVPSNRAVLLPRRVGFDVAACLGIPALTAYYGVTHGGDIEGKTVLVSGAAGAVGLYAIQFAYLLGARVVALVRSGRQEEIVNTLGCTTVIRSDEAGFASEIAEVTKEEGGVHRFVEVDLAANFSLISRIATPYAQVNAFASMSDFRPVLPFYEVFGKNLNIHPYLVFALPEKIKNKAASDITLWLEQDVLIHNIRAKFELTEIVAAHESAESSNEPGKVILEID